MRVSGSTPPCIASEVTATVSGPIISADESKAIFTGAINTTVSVICLFGSKVGTKSVDVGGEYLANSF